MSWEHIYKQKIRAETQSKYNNMMIAFSKIYGLNPSELVDN